MKVAPGLSSIPIILFVLINGIKADEAAKLDSALELSTKILEVDADKRVDRLNKTADTEAQKIAEEPQDQQAEQLEKSAKILEDQLDEEAEGATIELQKEADQIQKEME